MHYIGVDCGRVNDYAAIDIFEDRLIHRPPTIMPWHVRQSMQEVPDRLLRVYDAIHLEQIRGVSYPQVVRRVKQIVDNPRVSQDYVLVVDSTGVGIAIIDMMVCAGLFPIGVTFTAGREVTQGEQGYNVPKRDLVVNIQMLFQLDRINISSKLKLAPVFRDQLKGFTKDAHKGYETYGNDEKLVGNDDLVTAGAVVLWYAEKTHASEIGLPNKEPDPFDPARHGLGT